MENYELNQLLGKITDLKLNLRATDYQAIKYAEGEMTASEFADTKAKRKEWRREINVLEAKIEALRKE